MSNNPILIWGEGNIIGNLYSNYLIKFTILLMKGWVILTLDKAAFLKMTKVENDLDKYHAVGNANTQRQENEITVIMKKRNSAGCKLISKSTAIVDTKN